MALSVLRVIGFASVLTLAGLSEATACIVMPSTVKKRFDYAEKIFIGEIVSFSQRKREGNWIEETVVFRVLKAWKGVSVGELVTVSGEVSGGGSCGISARPAKSEDIYTIGFFLPNGDDPAKKNWEKWLIFDRPMAGSGSLPYWATQLMPEAYRDEPQLDRLVAETK